ncbi:hypothetical protein K438DRAFT_1840000 [Mycena galopus ATCC 62051]|nr:hypothetical protein K438DRAFT_1840000 [Mycena galopus ATCC 62051]
MDLDSPKLPLLLCFLLRLSTRLINVFLFCTADYLFCTADYLLTPWLLLRNIARPKVTRNLLDSIESHLSLSPRTNALTQQWATRVRRRRADEK